MNNELAWAAGFFDGEGGTYAVDNGGYLRAYLAIGQSDRESLERFQCAVGAGSICGPYAPGKLGKKPRYHYHVYSQDAVRAVLWKLWGYLGQVKRDQATNVLDKVNCARGAKL